MSQGWQSLSSSSSSSSVVNIRINLQHFAKCFSIFSILQQLCNSSQHCAAFCNGLEAKVLYFYKRFDSWLRSKKRKCCIFVAGLGFGWGLGCESVVFLQLDRWLAGVQGAKVGVQGAKVLCFCSWAWLWLGPWVRKCCVFIAGMAQASQLNRRSSPRARPREGD